MACCKAVAAKLLQQVLAGRMTVRIRLWQCTRPAHHCAHHALAVHQTSSIAGPGHDGAAARRALHLRRMGFRRLPLVAGQQHGEPLRPGTHVGTVLLRNGCCKMGIHHTAIEMVGSSCTAWHLMHTMLSSTGSTLIQITTQGSCTAGRGWRNYEAALQ